MVRTIVTAVLGIVVFLLLVVLYNLFASPSRPVVAASAAYSDFVVDVEANRVGSVVIQGSVATATMLDGRQYQTYLPDDPNFMARLLNHYVHVAARPAEEEGGAWRYVLNWVPLLAILGLLIFISRSIVRATNAMTEAVRLMAGMVGSGRASPPD